MVGTKTKPLHPLFLLFHRHERLLLIKGLITIRPLLTNHFQQTIAVILLSAHLLVPPLDNGLGPEGISAYLHWPKPQVNQACQGDGMEAVPNCSLSVHLLLYPLSFVGGLLLVHGPRISFWEAHQPFALPDAGHSFTLVRAFLGKQKLLLIGVRGKLHSILLPTFDRFSVTATEACRLGRRPPARNGTRESG